MLIVNRVDMVSEVDRAQWQAFLAERHQHVIWTNGETGLGIGQVSAFSAATLFKAVDGHEELGLLPGTPFI